MGKFLVTLEIRCNGSACGSTEDLIEASSPAEAERLAIEAWRLRRPDRTFAPLITTTLKED